MEDSQILSAFTDAPGRRESALVFDACQVGVVLRAVLFVEAATGVALMFGAQGAVDWLSRLALASGSALPATLAWLLAACSLKRWLAGLPSTLQHACGVGLGVLAGLWGGAMLALAQPSEPAPWLATACTGALLSALLVAALEWRARGRTPADTAARLAELQARIRPHFLFNTLNTAVALVRQDPARAEAVLEDLADLFRQALADPGESVTLSEEVALARRYLAIEQVRFGERLRIEWSLDPRAGAARVPHLLLQPLVENAVRHGVEPSDSGAQVRVRTERRGDAVVIEVANTLPAGPGPRGNGLAQENVRRRLALLHDVRARFRVTQRNGIYQVRMEIPA